MTSIGTPNEHLARRRADGPRGLRSCGRGRGYLTRRLPDILASPSVTVQNQLSDVLRKLDARDRTHAVAQGDRGTPASK